MSEFYAKRIKQKFSPIENRLTDSHRSKENFKKVINDSRQVNSLFNSKFQNLDEKFGKNRTNSPRQFSSNPSTDSNFQKNQSQRLIDDEIQNSRNFPAREMDMTIHERDLPFRPPR